MTPPRQDNDDDDEQVFRELETALTEALDLTRRGMLDQVQSRLPSIGQLLQQAVARGRHPGAPFAQALARIRTLHVRLCLTIAQQRGEVAGELAKLTRGKASIRAYSDN